MFYTNYYKLNKMLNYKLIKSICRSIFFNPVIKKQKNTLFKKITNKVTKKV